MSEGHSAGTKFKPSLPSHRAGWKRETSWTEARREKSRELTRGKSELGPTVRAPLPQGRRQADLAVLCSLGALNRSALNFTQKVNWERDRVHQVSLRRQQWVPWSHKEGLLSQRKENSNGGVLYRIGSRWHWGILEKGEQPQTESLQRKRALGSSAQASSPCPLRHESPG